MEKNGVGTEQLSKDDKECIGFVEKLLAPSRRRDARKTRYEHPDIVDYELIRYDRQKNRKLIKNWCMENRGYEKQVGQNQDDR